MDIQGMAWIYKVWLGYTRYGLDIQGMAWIVIQNRTPTHNQFDFSYSYNNKQQCVSQC